MDLEALVESLRARGLRSTPQRRAILAVLDGGRREHLSADEVHARASQALPGSLSDRER
jgi:Fur family transcriptional regulator, stress-responsive regulator